MPDLRSTYPAGQSQTTTPAAEGVDAGAYISALMSREAEWNAQRYQAARMQALLEARQRAAYAAAPPRVEYARPAAPVSSPAEHGATATNDMFGSTQRFQGNRYLVPTGFSPGMIPGMGPDMNDPRQRPQGSALSFGGAQEDALRSRAADGDFDRFKRDSQAGLHIDANGNYLPY